MDAALVWKKASNVCCTLVAVIFCEICVPASIVAVMFGVGVSDSVGVGEIVGVGEVLGVSVMIGVSVGEGVVVPAGIPASTVAVNASAPAVLVLLPIATASAVLVALASAPALNCLVARAITASSSTIPTTPMAAIPSSERCGGAVTAVLVVVAGGATCPARREAVSSLVSSPGAGTPRGGAATKNVPESVILMPEYSLSSTSMASALW